MNSQEKLLQYAEAFVRFTDVEKNHFISCFNEMTIRKKQFIVQPNFTARYRSFIVKGTFRAYVITNDGKECSIQFAVDNWWITDFNSYIYQNPATMFVVALEDSKVLNLDFEKEQELKKANHKFETLFRIMAEKGLAFEHRRIINNLTQTAEERYENFLLNFPLIAHRVPQYALASYLGMTTEFLSRIRNKRLPKKS